MQKVFTAISEDSPLKQLSGSKALFKKQLLRFGDWIDPIWPEEVMRHDRAFMQSLVDNFRNGIPGRIPVPLTHTDNPEYNTGELVDLMIEGDGTNLEDGLYGILEIRREDTAGDIADGLIWDVSISFTENYSDTQTGDLYGPTLLHVALVNNPYIKKMSPFKALADSLKRQFAPARVYMLSEQANVSNKETAMSKIKNDREFAVEVAYSEDDKETKVTLQPGEEVELAEDQVEAVQKQLADAEAPEGDDGEGDGGEGEDEKNLSEADRTKRELAEANAKIRTRDIEDSYQKALMGGKVVPAQEEAFKALANALHGQTRELADGKTQNLSELLAEFVEKAPKRVDLDEESGKNADGSDKGPLANLSEESKQGLAKAGVSEKDFVKYGSKESVSINELAEDPKED